LGTTIQALVEKSRIECRLSPSPLGWDDRLVEANSAVAVHRFVGPNKPFDMPLSWLKP